MGGSTPSTTTQNVIQKTELPEWYQTYLQNVMGRAVTQAGDKGVDANGKSLIPVQQIAGLRPDQLAAYQQVRDYATAAQPDYTKAGNLYGQQAGVDFQGAASPGMKSVDFGGAVAPGIAQMTAAGNRDTAATAIPYAQQGLGYLQSSAQGSSLANANPYIQASTQPTGLQAASPFLGAAAQKSYGDVSSYMNPYNQAVTDQIASLGARNLSENILPAISDQFVSSGQYGSQRQGVLSERALRDTQANILAQQNQALQAGYGQALNASQNDLSRQAGLAGTAGGLGSAQQQALLGAGQATGQLSSTDLARLQAAGVDVGQLGLGLAGAQSTDAARQLAAGQGVGQLGLSAAQAQGQYNLGQGQLGLSAAGQQATNYGNAAQGRTALGGARQTAGLQGASALESAGAADQGMQQAYLNTQYNNQLQQYNLPWDTIGKLSGVIQGLPVGGTTSGTTQTTAPGPSVAGQIGGIGLGVAGLANSGIFKKKGGAVRKPRQNHSYGTTPRRGLAIAA